MVILGGIVGIIIGCVLSVLEAKLLFIYFEKKDGKRNGRQKKRRAKENS